MMLGQANSTFREDHDLYYEKEKDELHIPCASRVKMN